MSKTHGCTTCNKKCSNRKKKNYWVKATKIRKDAAFVIKLKFPIKVRYNLL